jgi:hypothetical protein
MKGTEMNAFVKRIYTDQTHATEKKQKEIHDSWIREYNLCMTKKWYDLAACIKTSFIDVT